MPNKFVKQNLGNFAEDAFGNVYKLVGQVYNKPNANDLVKTTKKCDNSYEDDYDYYYSVEYRKCQDSSPVYLPISVQAVYLTIDGYCYQYYGQSELPPDYSINYIIEICDCEVTTTPVPTTTTPPDYYEYDACVEQPPTYQSVEYYQCYDFAVNGYSSVFVYIAIDEISPGVLNNPTQIEVGGLCYTIVGYSTTAVDTMSYTSGPCNCDNFSDEFRRCSDDAPIFIPLYTTFAANITYGGDCYYYMGPSSTEPDSLGSFTEDDCSC